MLLLGRLNNISADPMHGSKTEIAAVSLSINVLDIHVPAYVRQERSQKQLLRV